MFPPTLTAFTVAAASGMIPPPASPHILLCSSLTRIMLPLCLGRLPGGCRAKAAVQVPAGVLRSPLPPAPHGGPVDVEFVHLCLFGTHPVVAALLLRPPVAAAAQGGEGVVLPVGELLDDPVLAVAEAEGEGHRRFVFAERHLDLAADEINGHATLPAPAAASREPTAATGQRGRPPPRTRGSGWLRISSCRCPRSRLSAAPAGSSGWWSRRGGAGLPR